jgi:hypothetical protein
MGTKSYFFAEVKLTKKDTFFSGHKKIPLKRGVHINITHSRIKRAPSKRPSLEGQTLFRWLYPFGLNIDYLLIIFFLYHLKTID